MLRKLAASLALMASAAIAGSDSPSVEITNGLIHAKIYLPEAVRGFYRGTRFDWSGVIYSLQTGGHDYYGPWFDKTDPTVHDFVYRNGEIVAGPCSAATGPVDEFAPLGYDDVKVGGTFVKIGVGALRKDSSGKYDNYHLYEIANGGKWNVHTQKNRLDFTQTLSDALSGYSYVYQKTLLLVPDKTEMRLQHKLKNTGTKPIQTNVYNHNFLVLDRRAPGPGVVISVPFPIESTRPPKPELAGIHEREIRYLKTLEGEDVVATPLAGFHNNPADSEIRIASAAAGAGVHFVSDRPLLRESLWSIRSVIAMEPYTSITIEPGAEFTWTTTYEYVSAQ